MAAITQIRDPGTQGRISFERKLAEDKTKKGAIRFLKRRISYAVYSQLLLDAPIGDPGEQPGTTQCLRDRLFTLRDRLFGEVPRGPIKEAPLRIHGDSPGSQGNAVRKPAFPLAGFRLRFRPVAAPPRTVAQP
jgi:hypothetical protein